MKILIAGYPRSGKTTLAATFGGNVLHTDDVIALGWSEASAAVALWFDAPGPWVIEGVAIPRALRKWLKTNDGKPCDSLYYLDSPFAQLSGGQVSMSKGCDKVFNEIAVELARRGVIITVGAVDEYHSETYT